MSVTFQLYNDDNLNVMSRLPDESIDVICIDPPYLYLKGQKLERPFDERMFFSECQRLLTKKGFVVMFGRGPSFYRWNNILDDLGMVFKEEVIWDKSYSSSPLLALSRVHETISVYSKRNGAINRSKVPYLEMKRYDVLGVIQDIKRMRNILGNPASLKAVEDFLNNNRIPTSSQKEFSTTISGGEVKVQDRSASVMAIIKDGLNEKTIIRTDLTSENVSYKSLRGNCMVGDRSANAMQSIEYGLNEKTIIRTVRDHYSAIHPTQKPVRLLERLLNLVLPIGKEKIVIADWFMGSGSCGEAVHNISKEHPESQFEFIGTEIDEEYFQGADNRIAALQPLQKELFG